MTTPHPGRNEYIRTDLDNKANIHLSDNENGFIINEQMRIALLGLTGRVSRDDLTKRGLTTEQIDLVFRFYRMLQPCLTMLATGHRRCSLQWDQLTISSARYGMTQSKRLQKSLTIATATGHITRSWQGD